uniref:Uncharacterized protein n=1 Tax=Aegilops tauschii subsp. strangulata TaxID=200361 RepID=A0A453FEB1_AEGTS
SDLSSVSLASKVCVKRIAMRAAPTARHARRDSSQLRLLMSFGGSYS